MRFRPRIAARASLAFACLSAPGLVGAEDAPRGAAEGLERRIDALRPGGDGAEARAVRAEVAKLASKLEAAEPRRAARLWLRLGDALSRSARRHEEGEEAYRRGEGIARRIEDAGILAEAVHARGEALVKLRREREALPLFEEAARFFRKLGDRPADEAHNRSHCGAILANLDRPREAIAQFKRALRIYIDLGGKEEVVGEVLSHLGAAFQALDEHEDATKCFEKAEAILQKHGDERELARLASYRGTLYLRRELFDRALEELEKAAGHYEKAGDEEKLAEMLLTRAEAFSGRGEPAKSLPELERVGEIYERLGLVERLANLRLIRGAILFELGRLDPALEDLNQAVGQLQGLDDPISLARARQNRAAVLMETGRFEESLEDITEARKVYEAFGFRSEAADATMNRSSVLAQMGRFAEAISGFEQGMDLYEALGKPLSQAQAAANLGNALSGIGRHEEALAAYDRAAGILGGMGRRDILTQVSMNRASVLSRMGRHQDALKEIEGVAVALREGGSDADRARLAANLGTALEEVGRHADALTHLDEAVKLSRQLGDDMQLSTAIMNRGNVVKHLGREDEALEAFHEAERLSREIGDIRGIAMAATNRGSLLFARGRFEEALGEFDRSVDTFARVLRAEVQQLGEESSRAFRKDISGILTGALGALHRMEKPSARQIASAYRTAQVFHGLGMAEVLAERRGLVGARMPEDLRESQAGLVAALRRERGKARALASGERPVTLEEARRRSELLARARGEAARIEGELEKLEERVRARDRSYAAVAYPRPAAAADVQEALPAGAALVELIADDEAVTAFIVTRSGLEAVHIAKNADLTAGVEAALAALSPAKGKALPAGGAAAALRRLGKLVLDPVLARLPAGGGIRVLLVSPDGDLCRVPFEALLTADPPAGASPKEWPYLIKERTVAYVHSGTALRESVLAARGEKDRAGPSRFVAFGHPDYDPAPRPEPGPSLAAALDPKRSGYARLPGSGLEVLRIARLFADPSERKSLEEAEAAVKADPAAPSSGEVSGKRFTLFLGATATEDALKGRPEVKEARIVHLACHGRADLDAPLLSHLALSRPPGAVGEDSEDGLVTLRELRDLGVRAELAVLSACETGTGKLRPFEGLAGLSRAAMGAGARSVLSTLWQVQDNAARSLMESFYRHWLQGGATRAEALARAKREAIGKGLPLRTWSAYLLWDAGG